MFNFLFQSKIRYATRSPKWKGVREKHLSEYPCCAACGRSLKVEVNHIEPVHLNPNRELDQTNKFKILEPEYINFATDKPSKRYLDYHNNSKTYKAKIIALQNPQKGFNKFII